MCWEEQGGDKDGESKMCVCEGRERSEKIVEDVGVGEMTSEH